jgi:hypothetical protein
VWKAAEAVASPTMSARPWASAGCSVENGAEVVLDGRLRAQPFRCGCDFVAAGLAQHQRREDCGIGPAGPAGACRSSSSTATRSTASARPVSDWTRSMPSSGVTASGPRTFDRLPLCLLVVDAGDDRGDHVSCRDTADPPLAAAEHLRRAGGEIPPERGGEPHFHEVPIASTALIESVQSAVMVVAPETTVATPRQATASEPESQSSPRTSRRARTSSRDSDACWGSFAPQPQHLLTRPLRSARSRRASPRAPEDTRGRGALRSWSGQTSMPCRCGRPR